MKKGLLFSLPLLAAMLLALFAPVLAQEGITVISNTYEYQFPEKIIFRLEAQSGSEINDITLFYQIGIEEVTNRGYPEFAPGLTVKAEHEEKPQRGEIPPFSEIKYFWRIKDAAGNSLKTEPITFIYEDDRFTWQSLSDNKITLYWYDADQAFGQKLLDSAAQSLAHLEEKVGVELEQPIKIVVYQSKADMQEALQYRGEVHEEAIITLGTVVAKDIMLLHGRHQEVDQTIAHELTHVVVGLATDNPYGDIPAWLNEGLAMYNEGELRPGNALALERGIRQNKVFSIRSLTSQTGDPKQIDLWYGQVYSVVEFLLENYGKEKMAELLAVFKEGALYDDALMKVYGFDQDELDAQWRERAGLLPREVVIPTVTPVPLPTMTATPEPTPEGGGICGGICGGLLPAGLMIVGAVYVTRLRRASPFIR